MNTKLTEMTMNEMVYVNGGTTVNYSGVGCSQVQKYINTNPVVYVIQRALSDATRGMYSY